MWCGETGVVSLCRPQGSGSPKWFRFDDGEVVEAKIDDEEVKYCAVCVLYENRIDFRSLRPSVSEETTLERCMTMCSRSQ